MGLLAMNVTLNNRAIQKSNSTRYAPNIYKQIKGKCPMQEENRSGQPPVVIQKQPLLNTKMEIAVKMPAPARSDAWMGGSCFSPLCVL